jgi:hypothetical protein
VGTATVFLPGEAAKRQLRSVLFSQNDELVDNVFWKQKTAWLRFGPQ